MIRDLVWDFMGRKRMAALRLDLASAQENVEQLVAAAGKGGQMRHSIEVRKDEANPFISTYLPCPMGKLWVDDIRLPPDDTWEWATTPSDAIRMISTGEYYLVSMDHDLGTVKTGYDVLCSLERQIAKGGWWHVLPEFRVHSSNPVGRANMLRAIASMQKLAHTLGM